MSSTDPKKTIEPSPYPSQLNCAVELLEKHADLNRPAIYFQKNCWTYQDLINQVNKIANFLTHRLNLKPQDRILLNGYSSPILAACWFAIIKIGAICVTTTSSLKERELSNIIQEGDIKYAISDNINQQELLKAKHSTHLQELIFFNSNDANGLETLIHHESILFNAFPSNSTDTAIIAFTSGSTGLPKGIMHSHHDLMYICDCFPRDILQTTPQEIFCGTPPLAFTYGLGGILLFPLRYGAATILNNKLSAEMLLQCISEYKATTCFSSPTGYRLMLQHMHKYDLSSLKKCVSAGEPLSISTYTQWLNATGIKIIDGIGSTELLHIFISSTVDNIKPGSTGKPIPGYEAKIIDHDGKELSANACGFLAVRGPTGGCYLDQTLQTKYIKDGWSITGDLYIKDDEGYFWFYSRADNIILSAGYNISDTEIEQALSEHPAIQESAIVGVPDDTRGQLIKAYIILNDPSLASEKLEEDIKSFLKNKLSKYKCPHIITFIDKLPRNANGKVQKFIL